jgi:hypothetical protein
MYVLIFIVFIGAGGGPATAEFGTKTACEEARAQIEENIKTKYTLVRSVCVKKVQ